MPIYDYLCQDCGPFEAMRPMAEYEAPHDCPACGGESQRALLTAPRLALLSAETRSAHAVNERSRHMPRLATAGIHRHGPGCAAPAGRDGGKPKAAKGFPRRRPWMLSH